MHEERRGSGEEEAGDEQWGSVDTEAHAISRQGSAGQPHWRCCCRVLLLHQSSTTIQAGWPACCRFNGRRRAIKFHQRRGRLHAACTNESLLALFCHQFDVCTSFTSFCLIQNLIYILLLCSISLWQYQLLASTSAAFFLALFCFIFPACCWSTLEC
jgi:hypothetical protein